MTYRVGIGHDIALASLTTLEPQPRNGEVKEAERTYSDGGVGNKGLTCAFVWDAFESPEQYQAILEAFGLLDADTGDLSTTTDVTIYTRNEVWDWARYNGTAILPELGRDGEWRDYFPRNFRIIIRDLEQIA